MILIELTGAIDANGTIKKFYLSTEAFTTGPSDVPPDQEFKPYLVDPGAISFSIYEGEDAIAGGNVSLAIGDIVATNIDGEFDELKDYSFDGRQIVLRVGNQGGSYPADYPSIMVGTVDSIDVGWDQLIIHVQDLTYSFAKQILLNRFTGDNLLPEGLQGTADDLKGQLIPRTYGLVREISPPCVNTSKLTYRVNDGPVDDILKVYVRGAEITRGVNHASSAELQASIVTAGEYQTCIDEGLFRLDAADGLVTCDVIEGTSFGMNAARLLKRLAMQAGVAQEDINENDVIALDALNTAPLGRYLADEVTYLDVMNEIARSVGAWYGFDPLGKFRMGRLDVPQELPVATLSEFEINIGGMQRTPMEGMPRPLWNVIVNHTPIGEVQTSDLVGSVTAERRAFLAQPYRAATASQEDVKTQFLLAGSLTINSLIQDADAATQESARVLSLHNEVQDLFEVPVPMERAAELIGQGMWLGSELALNVKRFGLSEGKSFIVIGMDIQRRAKEILFKLWGKMRKPQVHFGAAVADALGIGFLEAVGQDATGVVESTILGFGLGEIYAVGGTVSSASAAGEAVGMLLAITQSAPTGASGIAFASGVGDLSAQAGSEVVLAGAGDIAAVGDSILIAGAGAFSSASVGSLAAIGGHILIQSLSSPSSALQTFTVPSTWVGHTEIEAIGAGGSGSGPVSGTVAGYGGAGGGYARREAVNLVPNSTIYYQLPQGGAALDTWFNDLNWLTATHLMGTGAGWGQNQVTVTTGQSDRLGGTTATRITENTTAAVAHSLYQIVSKPASTQLDLTLAVEVKKINGPRVALSCECGNARLSAVLNFADGTLSSNGYGTDLTELSKTVTDMGGGWYRIVFKVRISATHVGTTFAWTVGGADATGSVEYTGTGLDILYTSYPIVTYGQLDKGYTANVGSTPIYSVLARYGPNASVGGAGVALTSGGQGDAVRNGGNGGANNGGAISGGGGGAAGINGAGGAGSSSSGGSADGGLLAGGALNTAGGNGTEWASVGSGSGGGPRNASLGGLNGGAFGGGGSGAGAGTGLAGGSGSPGLIVMTSTDTAIGEAVATASGYGELVAYGSGGVVNKVLRDVICVSCHFIWPTWKAGPYSNISASINALNYLGVGMIRDQLGGNNGWPSWSDEYAIHRQFMAAGFKFCLWYSQGQTVTEHINRALQIETDYPGAIAVLEGDNEIDNALGFTYGGQSGYAAYRLLQIDYTAAIKAQPKLANIKIAAHSISNVAAFQTAGAAGPVTNYVDYGTQHDYWGVGMPTYAYSPGCPYEWNKYIVAIQTYYAINKPVIVTECGSSNDVITENVSAVMIFNSIFVHQKQNGFIPYTIYELVNNTQGGTASAYESNLGLFRGDWSPKPIATIVHNLLHPTAGVMGDSYPSNDFSISVSGLDTRYSYGEKHLLFKRPGGYAVVVWVEPDIWNEGNNTEAPATPQNGTLTINTTAKHCQMVDLFPNHSTTPTTTDKGTSTSFTFSIVDHPLIFLLD